MLSLLEASSHCPQDTQRYPQLCAHRARITATRYFHPQSGDANFRPRCRCSSGSYRREVRQVLSLPLPRSDTHNTVPRIRTSPPCGSEFNNPPTIPTIEANTIDQSSLAAAGTTIHSLLLLSTSLLLSVSSTFFYSGHDRTVHLSLSHPPPSTRDIPFD